MPSRTPGRLGLFHTRQRFHPGWGCRHGPERPSRSHRARRTPDRSFGLRHPGTNTGRIRVCHRRPWSPHRRQRRRQWVPCCPRKRPFRPPPRPCRRQGWGRRRRSEASQHPVPCLALQWVSWRRRQRGSASVWTSPPGCRPRLALAPGPRLRSPARMRGPRPPRLRQPVSVHSRPGRTR